MLKKLSKILKGNKFSSKIFLVFLIVLVVFSKFLFLDRFPVNVSHDEVEYLLSGLSIAKTGSDITRYSFPEFLFRTETMGFVSPVPVLTFSVLFKLLPVSQFNARLLMTGVNLITALVLYKFSIYLFKVKNIGLLAALLFLINPWSMFLSRWAVDSPFALLFYLIGIYAFLKFRNYWQYSSLGFFILGFFSYHGAKPLFLPLILVLIIYKFLAERSKVFSKKRGIVYIILAAFFLISYFLLDNYLPGEKISSRSSELIFSDMGSIESVVGSERRQTIVSPFNTLFINKATVLGDTFLEKYLKAFSVDVLFLKGDIRATYRYENFGLLYPFEIMTILIGMATLVLKSKKPAVLLFSLILLAPISTALNNVETSVINRSFLLLPMFIIVSAYGINNILKVAKTKSTRRLIGVGALGVVTLFYLSFLHFYFFKHPVRAQENYFLSEKLVSSYINYLPRDQKVVVVGGIPRETALEHLFHSPHLHTTTGLSSLPDTLDAKIYQFGNVEFVSSCPTSQEETTIYIVKNEKDICEFGSANNLIQNQKDAGIIYSVYNSNLCDGIKLDSWRRDHILSDYNIKKMNTSEFCNRWIAKPL